MARNPLPHEPEDRLIAAFLAAQRGWSRSYRQNHLLTLNHFARYIRDVRGTTLQDATRADCDAYFDHRCATLAGSSANKEWLRVRAFYLWAVDNGDVSSPRDVDFGPMQKVTRPPMSQPDPARTRTISEEDYATLMAGWDPRKLTDCRNAAMCSLMYRTGLRGIEVTRIDADRMHLDGAVPTIEVLGKGRAGGKWRTVPVAHETMVWIERYKRRLVVVPESGPFFLSTWNGHPSSGGRMTVDSLHEMIRVRSEKLGLNAISAHQFRRSFATDARERGVRDSTIQEIAGWADPRMLHHYSRTKARQIAVAEFAAADPTAIPDDVVRRGKRGRARLRAV